MPLIKIFFVLASIGGLVLFFASGYFVDIIQSVGLILGEIQSSLTQQLDPLVIAFVLFAFAILAFSIYSSF